MPILSRSNIVSHFNFINTSYLLLRHFLFIFKLSAWVKLLKKNLKVLKIYLTMIFKFRAEIDYKSFQNMLIFSKNLVSAMEDLFIINNKLAKDIQLCWVVFIPIPTAFFILLSLTLVFKHERRFRQIYPFLYLKRKSTNDYISEETKKLQYA